MATLGENYEIVGSKFIEPICEYIVSRHEGEDTEQYTGRLKNWTEYQTKNNGSHKLIMENYFATYDDLPEILEIAGLTFKAAFLIAATSQKNAETEEKKIEYLTPRNSQFLEILQICETLEDKKLKEVYQLAKRLSFNVSKAANLPYRRPARRICEYYYRKVSIQERKDAKNTGTLPKALENISTKAGQLTHSISVFDFPEVANYLNVPLHWILFENSDVLVNASKPIVEKLIDKFAFIPEEGKIVFLDFFKEFAKKT
ncbi:MAG: hypothetical protein LUF68_07495 [Clostridiales bacterium]|nr:hypothetical protein [Clostridiales bacterium]